MMTATSLRRRLSILVEAFLLLRTYLQQELHGWETLLLLPMPWLGKQQMSLT